MNVLEEMSFSLARFIKNKRTQEGLTQEQLASAADIDYKHIQNIESTKKINDPKLSTLLKLAEALNISVSDITSYIFSK